MPATRKWLLLACVLSLIILGLGGCRGFRRPMEATPVPGAAAPGAEASVGSGQGWTLIPLNVASTAEGKLHVDMALRNDTGLWSAMAAEDKPATLVTNAGKTLPCDTVKVSSGGHYIPPGFQFRGYTLKDNSVQLLSVECGGADPYGAKITVPYTYVTGEYDYYAQEKGKAAGTLEADLGKVQATLTYPVAAADAPKVRSVTEPIAALNDTTLTNTGVSRTDEGIALKWTVTNPGEYDTKVHVGEPPVLGNDGIIYGARVSPDIVDQPFSPGKGSIEFGTQVKVPRDVAGLFLLLSVEETRERLFANYLIDLSSLK